MTQPVTETPDLVPSGGCCEAGVTQQSSLQP